MNADTSATHSAAAHGEEVSVTKGRFISSENWGHYFADGAPETEVRWVFDSQRGRVAILHVRDAATWGWYRGYPEEVLDLEECLIDNGQGYFKALDDWELVSSDELPDWALDAVAPDRPKLTDGMAG